MTDPFEVFSSERGVVRIFTTELDAEGSSAVTPKNVHRLLGEGLDLDAGRIEVFPSTALEAMGLSVYLQEGYGIPEADLSGQAAALDALKGLVILVASGAFKGEAVTLNPKPVIRFVGAFREPAMAPPTSMAAPEAAEGVLEPGGRTPPQPAPRGSSWPVAVLALLFLAILVLLLNF